MKKFMFIFLCSVVTATNIVLLLTHNSNAQQTSFLNVIPFSTQSGRMGFFNQNDGMIYIYDADVKNLMFKAQLKELGTTIGHIERNDLPSDNKFNGKTQSIIVPTNSQEQK